LKIAAGMAFLAIPKRPAYVEAVQGCFRRRLVWQVAPKWWTKTPAFFLPSNAIGFDSRWRLLVDPTPGLLSFAESLRKKPPEGQQSAD
jgi:hypothetical protein